MDRLSVMSLIFVSFGSVETKTLLVPVPVSGSLRIDSRLEPAPRCCLVNCKTLLHGRHFVRCYTGCQSAWMMEIFLHSSLQRTTSRLQMISVRYSGLTKPSLLSSVSDVTNECCVCGSVSSWSESHYNMTVTGFTGYDYSIFCLTYATEWILS